MLSFLRRDLPAFGRVLYPGVIPPPFERIARSEEAVAWTPATAQPGQSWAAEATHPVWGSADMVCERQPAPLPETLIDCDRALSAVEKAQARPGQATIAVRVHARQKHVLRDRKGLLYWLRTLMQADGAVAIDGSSTMLWSKAMLDDELAHDADLDIESLYAIHAVQDPGRDGAVSWMHTHGLEALGAFDVDVLEPSPLLVSNCGDPIRALAFAALEGTIDPDTDRFQLAWPGGEVRLVPVERFHALAATEHKNLRDLDQHSGRRAVLCEPVGGLLGRWRTRPVPSRFLSRLNDDRVVFPFSTAATALMADRARRTLGVFLDLQEEFASLELPALMKLGFEVEGGGPADREHLWFEVHAVAGGKVDATLANVPNRVPGLTAGQRGEHDLDRLSDWTIMSPEGPMTPRNLSAARRLREARA
ncbi:MAG TPA: DUF4026 domain-containing protein [Vicinamibacterales bacterium]|nr:DUF4026 domain-containing protein [Vicinamibacterales bacterium]